jgi:hypothetical protein
MDEQTYKSAGKKTLFDAEFTMENLSEIGNPLKKIVKVIDFEMFRSILEGKLLTDRTRTMPGRSRSMWC